MDADHEDIGHYASLDRETDRPFPVRRTDGPPAMERQLPEGGRGGFTPRSIFWIFSIFFGSLYRKIQKIIPLIKG